MKLIKGNNLNTIQQQQVLNSFIYRWTTGNIQCESVWHNITGKPTMQKQTDKEWLNNHSFWFLNNGSRLSQNKHYAEPAFLAD